LKESSEPNRIAAVFKTLLYAPSKSVMTMSPVHCRAKLTSLILAEFEVAHALNFHNTYSAAPFADIPSRRLRDGALKSASPQE